MRSLIAFFQKYEKDLRDSINTSEPVGNLKHKEKT